ncbi:NUDIX domain-containing protein [Streptomyces sp. NPDC002589]|uniref:NUDIX domain-containing protein n=1 Tax=Streptomyces sp. NPDC002589 TaxID=3154420 RepID=UPI00332CFF4B
MDAPHDASPDSLPRQPRMSDADYSRSRHAVWMSAAALFTDPLGRVLLVQPAYRDQWLLPGGAAEHGESPAQACAREVREELGLTRPPGRLLAVHWLPPDHPDINAGMAMPGEVRYILDGGTLTEEEIAALHLPANELLGFEFVDSTRTEERMIPVDGQIVLAALRARLSGTTAHLEGGRHVGEMPPLDRHQVYVRPRAGRTWPWHPEPVPAHLQVKQAWGWLFTPDGRVVLVVDPAKRLPTLPGGTVEATDTSPEEALRREVMEEAQVTLGDDIVRLGWVYDATGDVYGGIGPCARLRLAAPVTTVGPACVDPATGRAFARLLATPDQAAALLGSGETGYRQAELAARFAHERWGIPHAVPGPVTELAAMRS